MISLQLLQQTANYNRRWRASMFAHADRQKDVLRDIKTDRGNLDHGRLLEMEFTTTSSWHIDAVAGAVHPITTTGSTTGWLASGWRGSVVGWLRSHAGAITFR